MSSLKTAVSRFILPRVRSPHISSPVTVRTTRSRTLASSRDETSPTPESGPNMQQQEHVSEEAAKMAKITGGTGPDLSQGTPVQELLKKDPEAQKLAPKAIKESIKSGHSPPKPQTRPFSTLARRLQDMNLSPPDDSSALPLSMAPSTEPTDPSMAKGHKFALPTLPIPSQMRKDHRYDPVVQQCTNLIMKDGRLSVAQRIMSEVLQHLRTAPTPIYSPARPLTPGAPPASYLPLNPITYLTVALDSIAPLLRIRSQRGAAGGGQALQIPVPLNERQRRRKAFTWLLEMINAKPSRGSGRTRPASRIAEEVIAIVEGRSTLWTKKYSLHKQATTVRINVHYKPRKVKKL